MILFHVPISRLVSSQTLAPLCPSSHPHCEVALAAPQLFPFILAVSYGPMGVQVPKAQGFARIREAQTAICLGSEGEHLAPLTAQPSLLPWPSPCLGESASLNQPSTGPRQGAGLWVLLGCAWGWGGSEAFGVCSSMLQGLMEVPGKCSGWAQRGEEMRCQSSNAPPQPHPSTFPGRFTYSFLQSPFWGSSSAVSKPASWSLGPSFWEALPPPAVT